MSTLISPPDDALIPAVKQLRVSQPSLGAAKLHGLLLKEHPEWTVSEKRLKKVLQNEGLTLGGGAGNIRAGTTNDKTEQSNTDSITYPRSKLNPHLDISKFTTKVEAIFISEQKGKGLVAKAPVAEGEVVWKEDPFVHAAEWDLYDLQQKGTACQHCALPFLSGVPTLAVPCPAVAQGCNAMFCSRLCLNRGLQAGHLLLCRGRNPASRGLLEWIRKETWRSMLAVSLAVAKIMTAWERSDAEGREMIEAWGTFATLDQEERARMRPDWVFAEQRERAMWNMAYDQFVTALCPPETDQGAQVRMKKIVKKVLPEDVREELFSYRGFLRGLGRVSLNLEAYGGLFLLHSHLNHSCVPNMKLNRPLSGQAQKYPSSKIAVFATRTIEPSEELTVTYVNPAATYWQRKQGLKDWGIECTCEKCEREKTEQPEPEKPEGGENGVNDLERELRMSFGV